MTTMEYENKMATREYESSKTLVYWDINNCPIPDGYDPMSVGPRIKSALRKLGYVGPVTIMAFGNLPQVGKGSLKKLYFSGIALRHGGKLPGYLSIRRAYIKWRVENEGAPVSIMLISNSFGVEFMSATLAILKANNLLAYPTTTRPERAKDLETSAEWVWNDLLNDDDDLLLDDSHSVSDSSDMLWCDLCGWNCNSFKDYFANHLRDKGHLEFFKYKGSGECQYKVVEFVELVDPPPQNQASAEYANSKTLVCWDINNCPIPDGVDTMLVGPRIKLVLRKFGYVGPVTIRAVGNLHLVLEKTLEKLYSSGIALRHTGCGTLGVIEECEEWREGNEGEDVSIMLITCAIGVECMSISLASMKANRLLAYPTSTTSARRVKDLVTSGEWDWNELLLASSSDTKTKPPLVEEGDDIRCDECKFKCKRFADFTEHLRVKGHEKMSEPVPKGEVSDEEECYEEEEECDDEEEEESDDEEVKVSPPKEAGQKINLKDGEEETSQRPILKSKSSFMFELLECLDTIEALKGQERGRP